jgi:hypothetical protein
MTFIKNGIEIKENRGKMRNNGSILNLGKI